MTVSVGGRRLRLPLGAPALALGLVCFTVLPRFRRGIQELSIFDLIGRVPPLPIGKKVHDSSQPSYYHLIK
jgi:hypothetical protein